MKPSLKLYRFNTRSGLWDYQRTCDETTGQEWIAVFQRDEPAAYFRLARHAPKHDPCTVEAWR